MHDRTVLVPPVTSPYPHNVTLPLETSSHYRARGALAEGWRIPGLVDEHPDARAQSIGVLQPRWLGIDVSTSKRRCAGLPRQWFPSLSTDKTPDNPCMHGTLRGPPIVAHAPRR